MRPNQPTILRALGAIAAMAAFSLASAQTATITLRYDDSKNPSPFSQVYYCANVDPQTGAYVPDWGGFLRRPMYDDGQHGDGKAGDRIWGARIAVQPKAGQLFEWAVDDDNDQESWLGPCPPFLVEKVEEKLAEGRSMPEEAFMAPAEIARKYSISLSQAAPPRRIPGSDKVLLVHQAPDAKRVYLAGDFNNWGSNDNGRIRDLRTTMYPSGEGTWFRLITPRGEQFAYKFVEENAAGEFHWTSDPKAENQDESGNTVIKIEELAEIASTTAGNKGTSRGGISWKPFSARALDEQLQEAGRVLVYVRMDGNTRCREFEQQTLLSPEVASLLEGTTVFFADASKADHMETIREMGVIKVPTIAQKRRGEGWSLHSEEQLLDNNNFLNVLRAFTLKETP